MPTPTFTALAKTVLTGSQATITFSGISNVYKDLVLLCSIRGDGSSDFGIQPNITVNGSSTSDYSRIRLEGYANGGAAATASDNSTGGSAVGGMAFPNAAASSTTNTFGTLEIYIPNYAGSTNKVFSVTSAREVNATTWYNLRTIAALRSNTAAITSIEIAGGGQNFVSGSSFYLYGIKNS